MLLSAIVFRWLMPLKPIPSIMLAVCSQLYAFFTFSIFIVGWLLYLFEFSYNAIMGDRLSASLFLFRAIFTVMQVTFFLIVNQWYRLNITQDHTVNFLL